MTESVPVTSEDVKTPTNKPNPKPLKASNDYVEHGKPSEKAERPLTKVVVRHLPPTMTLELFLEQVSPLPPVDYMYFVKADSSLGLLSFSRAYLNFVNVQDLIIFTEKFDNYVFIDAKGNEYPAIVEFAPFQRIPKQRTNRKKDPRAGTIENDPYYLDFVEALKAEEAQRKSASKTNKQHFFETTSTNTTAQKVTSTPLLEYLKARKLDKIRVKEDKINEKKKRELERKKAREERSSGRQGEGDAHPVKVVTPPHGRNDRGESVAMHSPSVRHSDDKRPAREVKRREDDRTTRTRDRDRERDADARPKDSKRPGKSYQEERQRLSERRQTAKVAPSRSGKEVEDGRAEAEVAAPKGEDGRRPEKGARPSAKAQDPKKTPERPRRPERKPVGPKEPREPKEPKEPHKEERKKSYAQEREQRRNSVRKDGPTTSEEARPNPIAPTDKSAPDKEKSEQAAPSSKGKDPRAERRIRNKDRPSIEIYRPGMGRFSRQRLEREKGSVVGSSTERDSASPSPSPSPSVSRAASVTAKSSTHSKHSENTPNQPASAKAEGTAAPKEDKAAEPEDIAAETEDAADKAPKTEDTVAEREDKTEGIAAETEDTADKAPITEDIAAKSEDTAPKTEDIAAKTEAAKTEDIVAETEGAADKAVKTEDKLAKTEDVAAKSEDTDREEIAKTADERDAPATVEDIATKTEKGAAKAGGSAAIEDMISKVEDTSSKREDEEAGSSSKAEGEPRASKTEETLSKAEDPPENPGDSATESSPKDESVKGEDPST